MAFSPLSLESHGNALWRRPTDFQFAAKDLTCPISLSEMGQAMKYFPIGFVLSGNNYEPVIILGCQSDQNLFIGLDGRWVGEYLPIKYKSFPFCLLPIANDAGEIDTDKMALCLDDNFQLSLDAANGERIFADDGGLSEFVTTVSDQLSKYNNSIKQTLRCTALLGKKGLLKPWDTAVNLGERKIAFNGLYCVDELALKQLPGQSLVELVESDALPLAYMQLISMENLARFPSLIAAHEKARNISSPDLDDLTFDDSANNEMINLDNL